jgi:hypothetical protein
MFRLNRYKPKTNRNCLIESIFWYFSENLGLFQLVSVCFETFNGFDIRYVRKTEVFGFTKQTEIQAKQTWFRVVSVQTEIFFCLFRGHPTLARSDLLCGTFKIVAPFSHGGTCISSGL